MGKILEKLQMVPHLPGVYQMLDASAHVIYIGKAKDLYKRLCNYFVNKAHDTKTTALLTRVDNFEYFVVPSENDALALEANLINKHKPHYNILLKDDKKFPYIRITDSKIEITRHINQGGKYFGPYFNGIWASGLLDTIYDIYEVRERADKDTLEKVKAFLSGQHDTDVKEILNEKMHQASAMEQYELAIRYRNGLRFLDKLKERTIANVARNVNCDVFASASSADVFVVSVLTVRAGNLIGVQNFTNKNDSPKDDPEKLQEFIGQYYLEHVRPTEVITAAARGYKKNLLKTAQANAREYIETSIEKINFKAQFTIGAVEELKTVLGMEVFPKKIECFDISHMGGEGVVASMVVCIDGIMEKKLYRKFNIKWPEGERGNNDTLSMHEVLTRRFKRLGGIDPSFGPAPDLIIVDGGKGQLTSALAVRTANESEIALAAFSEHNEIFLPQRTLPIILDKRSYALRLLQRIRDEAHRFAVGFQVTKRGGK